MKAQNLFETFGRSIGAEGLSFNEMGLCRITFNDATVIDFEELDQYIYLFSVLGPLPENDRDLLLMTLMRAHFANNDVATAYFGLNSESEITLFARIPYETTSVKAFEEFLAQFINACDEWRPVVATACNDAGAAQPDARPDMTGYLAV